MTTFSPEAFGRYYLVDKIATGGMAEVFKAKSFSHGGFEKLLVIKRILHHLSENDEFVEMFIDEAKISVELQQPNIVQIYDFGRILDNYFIAMECVEGKDVKGILRKMATKRKLLPTEFAVYIAHEVSKGLEYAHKKTNINGELLGIVHRDISPSNVLLSYNGDVKIADFGIAKARISAYNTKDGVLKGKFEYMSPEQASGRTADPRADIFSTGIVLHEMLTGRRLFKTDSEIKTLERIKAGDAPAPSTLNPGVPARLDAIVMRALARDPDDRYPDARALQTALLEFSYPATPDLTRESLAHFIQELFIDEIEEERGRLKHGTRVANEMYASAPEIDLGEWEEGDGPSQTTIRTQPSRTPMIAAIIGLVTLAVVVVFLAMRPFPSDPAPQATPLPTAPSLGQLQLRIQPEVSARITLNGEVIGIGFNISHERVPPEQDLELRIEADGYEPFVDTVRLQAGERLRLPIRLAPAAAVSPTREERSPRITETPKEEPKATPRPDVEPKQETPRAAQKGRVSVNVRDGWAEVYIDGRKVDTTPCSRALSAGSHSIRVVNPNTGFTSSRKVVVEPGKTARVVF